MTTGRSQKSVKARVFDILLKEIQDGVYPGGTKLPPLKILAKKFNVGLSSVHEAFGLLEKDGYVDIRHGDGTYVIEAKERFDVANVICACFDIFQDYHADIFHSLCKYLNRIGKTVAYFDLKQDDIKGIESITKSEISHFIIMEGMLANPVLQSPLFKNKHLIVIVDGSNTPIEDTSNISFVSINVDTISSLLFDYFNQHDYKNILVAGVKMMIASAYNKKLKRRSLPKLWQWSKQFNITTIQTREGNNGLTVNILELAQLLAQKDAPEVVFGLRDADVRAIQQVLFLHAPEKLRKLDFIGHFNTPHSQYSLQPFSTIDRNSDQMAKEICQLIEQDSKRRNILTKEIVIEPKLVLRGY